MLRTRHHAGPAGIALAVALAAALAAPWPADAQPLDERDRCITSALLARARHDHHGALTWATRAAQLRDTPSLRLFIAREQAALGQTHAALASARACATRAKGTPGTRNRGLIEATCRSLAGALERSVGRVPPAGAVASPSAPR